MLIENFAIETRIMKVSSGEAKLDGRYLQGFINNTVTGELVDEVVENSEIEVSTIGDNTTMVRCVLPNGFSIIETSSCVIKENYSQEVGAEICMEKIKNKIWELLGFLFMTGLNGFNPKKIDTEKMIDEAILVAFDEIFKEEHGESIEFFKNTRLYQKHREKAVEILDAKQKADLVEIVEGEDLEFDDIVELIVGLYLASK